MKKYLLDIKQFLVALWQLLDGRKREIAKLYWFVVAPMVPVFNIPVESITFKVLALIGAILTGAGWGHAVVKAGSTSEPDGENAQQ
jgi:hypothetical protein